MIHRFEYFLILSVLKKNRPEIQFQDGFTYNNDGIYNNLFHNKFPFLRTIF